jgi:hypothetical protein
LTWSINNKGVIVGSYVDGNGVQHGFLRAGDGTFTTFDPPGAMRTNSNSINDKGETDGAYWDANNQKHGFFRAVDGTITTFDIQDCSDDYGIFRIDNGGHITGYCYDDEGNQHGFEWWPKGKAIVFDPPGSTATWANGIGTGEIAGYYADNNSILHGYLRSK